jgi:glucose/arabinose dehydrogenase
LVFKLTGKKSGKIAVTKLIKAIVKRKITAGHMTNLFEKLLFSFLFSLIANLSAFLPLQAQFKPSDNMNPMEHGPFVTTTIAHDPLTMSSIFVNKGIAVKVGAEAQAVMTFDTDLLRVASAWTGGFLHWYLGRDGLEDWPSPDGITHFETGKTPGWSLDGDFDDPRTWPYGPIPKEQGRYNGLYINGENILFSYTIGDSDVLELPGFEQVDGHPVFTRTFNLSPTEETMSLRVLQVPENAEIEMVSISDSKVYITLTVGNNTRCVGLQGVFDAKPAWRIENRHLILDLPGLTQAARFKLAIGPILSGLELNYMASYLDRATSLSDLSELKNPGPDQWETVQTQAVMGDEEGPFTVDELTLPAENPWKSFIRLMDVDFFSDGRAVVVSLSGDVWLVDGIEEELGTLLWHRFATGLFQPSGVKVVNDQIYVTGRDQITRLNDLNDDGFADHYENFNNELMASTNFHAFTLNLETDAQGNFYFAKSTPWPPYLRGEGPSNDAEITPHHGVLFKLSPDGEQLDIIARGLRNPNGMDISPEGEMIYADNEGNWVPTSKVHRIKQEGFHGFIPSAHQQDIPDTFEPPIIWTPHYMDNSPAKPMFIKSDKWPEELQDDLLLASYGRGSLSLILMEEVDGVWQGAHLNLPLMFKSGLERGRFKNDGHLYITGMTSWQSIGEDWGSFHRVRYTGKPLNVPVSVQTKAGGIELRFSQKMDPQGATNSENYRLQKWTYPWTSQYGTRGKQFSIDNPGKTEPDPVQIEAIRLSDDGKSVFIEIPFLKPGVVNTSIGTLEALPDMIDASLGLVMSISYQISTTSGEEFSHLIHKTIHRVPTEGFER